MLISLNLFYLLYEADPTPDLTQRQILGILGIQYYWYFFPFRGHQFRTFVVNRGKTNRIWINLFRVSLI